MAQFYFSHIFVPLITRKQRENVLVQVETVLFFLPKKLSRGARVGRVGREQRERIPPSVEAIDHTQ